MDTHGEDVGDVEHEVSIDDILVRDIENVKYGTLFTSLEGIIDLIGEVGDHFFAARTFVGLIINIIIEHREIGDSVDDAGGGPDGTGIVEDVLVPGDDGSWVATSDKNSLLISANLLNDHVLENLDVGECLRGVQVN